MKGISMGKKTIYFAAVILTIINLAALGTWVYNRYHGEGRQSLTQLRNEQFERLQRELSLSPEQVRQIQMYRGDFLRQMDSLSAQLAGERTEMANELWQTAPNTLRLDSLVNRISQVQSAAQRKVIAHLLDVKSVLDPEQRQKFYRIVLRRFANGSEQPMPDLHVH